MLSTSDSHTQALIERHNLDEIEKYYQLRPNSLVVCCPLGPDVTQGMSYQ